MFSSRLAAGRDAFARRAWRDAYAELSAADDALTPLAVDDLERLAMSAYMTGKDEISADLWARAHSECLRLHDIPRATRSTFWLVLDLLTKGEGAQANGWLARAQRLLDDAGADCAERGLLLVLIARSHIRRGDITGAYAAASQAVSLARRFDDPELNIFSQLCFAQVIARRGDAAGATALFDEIMVAVTVGDVSPIAIGTVYCAVIEGCLSLLDLGRAREWTAALSRWCNAQPDLVPFRGQCLVHRAELLRLAGAWTLAIAEAEQACNWLTQSVSQVEPLPDTHRLSSFKYPVGAAFYELGEIHRLRGTLGDAEVAYQHASEYGYMPEPGLALLRVAQQQDAVAAAAIRRALGEVQSRQKRVAILEACVEIMIAVGDLAAARAAAGELAALSHQSSAPYLRTLSAHATGSVLLADGDAPAALTSLRLAWMGWQELEAPWEAARVRVLLGLCCRALGDDDTAELEFEAADRVFRRLGAAPDLARVAALRHASSSGGARVLTPRERQILALIATGKTNRAIADELAISDRTVDRHVSNILTKLELPSRSAATAYAYEQGLLSERT